MLYIAIASQFLPHIDLILALFKPLGSLSIMLRNSYSQQLTNQGNICTLYTPYQKNYGK